MNGEKREMIVESDGVIEQGQSYRFMKDKKTVAMVPPERHTVHGRD